MKQFDVLSFRQEFPLLGKEINFKSLIYLDNAATTQKPKSVIDSSNKFYQQQNANVHRASHQLSTEATRAFEAARSQMQRFINASSEQEVIWTKGATESINLIASSWGENNISEGDEIVLSHSEHHANIVPWQILAKRKRAAIKVLSLTDTGTICQKSIEQLITEKTKLVAVGHISNVIGKINPIETIIKRAKQVGAISVIDGAQAIAHQKVDVRALDCDFYVFSAHKMFGPTGVGVLYGKQYLLEAMQPYQAGGEMIDKVSFSGTSFTQLPFKFEPGTPNIAGVVAVSSMLSFIEKYQERNISCYESKLIHYAYDKLSAISGLDFIVSGKPDIPIFSFTIAGHHNQDISTAIDSMGIAIRNGHHCAMPLMEYLNLDGCMRVSLAAYNTFEEIDKLAHALIKITSEQGESKAQILESTLDRALLEEFINARGWDGKHRALMLLSKKLERMPVEERSEQTLISGCESKAWVTYKKHNDGSYVFHADSDAKVIRGLLVVVLTAFNNKTKKQILSFNIDAFFEELGLIAHLSPSRGNGLRAIVDKVKEIVS